MDFGCSVHLFFSIGMNIFGVSSSFLAVKKGRYTLEKRAETIKDSREYWNSNPGLSATNHGVQTGDLCEGPTRPTQQPSQPTFEQQDATAASAHFAGITSPQPQFSPKQPIPAVVDVNHNSYEPMNTEDVQFQIPASGPATSSSYFGDTKYAAFEHSSLQALLLSPLPPAPRDYSCDQDSGFAPSPNSGFELVPENYEVETATDCYPDPELQTDFFPASLAASLGYSAIDEQPDVPCPSNCVDVVETDSPTDDFPEDLSTTRNISPKDTASSGQSGYSSEVTQQQEEAGVAPPVTEKTEAPATVDESRGSGCWSEYDPNEGVHQFLESIHSPANALDVALVTNEDDNSCLDALIDQVIDGFNMQNFMNRGFLAKLPQYQHKFMVSE